MTKDDAIKLMRAIDGGDREEAHVSADEVLIEFLMTNGHREVAETWIDTKDRVGFWYA